MSPSGHVTLDDFDPQLVELEAVEVPEMGGKTLHLRPVSAGEVMEFSEMPTDTPEQRREQMEAQFVVLAKVMVDENGRRIIPEGEESKARNMPAGAFVRLMRHLTAGMGIKIQDDGTAIIGGSEGNG